MHGHGAYRYKGISNETTKGSTTKLFRIKLFVLPGSCSRRIRFSGDGQDLASNDAKVHLVQVRKRALQIVQGLPDVAGGEWASVIWLDMELFSRRR